MKIYLAGKIGVNDWRHEIVDGLHDAEFGSQILDRAILGRHDYTGPFFLNEGHGMTHGEGLHGAGVPKRVDEHCVKRIPHSEVFVNSLCGIRNADVVIAVVEDDAHGTLCEIGYASGIGKRVFVIGTEGKQCWFAQGFAVGGFEFKHYRTLDAAFEWCNLQDDVREFLDSTDSPAERAFAEAIAWSEEEFDKRPVTQYKIGTYRVDFAFLDSRLVVEIDGIEFHGNQEAFISDRKRTRYLEAEGWRVVRFAAKEVLDKQSSQRCAEEVWEIHNALMYQRSNRGAE